MVDRDRAFRLIGSEGVRCLVKIKIYKSIYFVRFSQFSIESYSLLLTQPLILQVKLVMRF